jgi:NAD(P)H-dependent FMN reductase
MFYPLKNAIDFLYHEWRYKPVGFVSYGGMSGGLRAVQMMKQVVTTLRMVPAGEAVTVFTRRQLDADGRLVVDDDLSASATGMLDELGRLTQAMAAMRSAS